jgi:hypothetical protein
MHIRPEYNPHPVATLTGVVTSEGIGKRCGDAPFEGSSNGLRLPLTPHAEAERLAVSDADKNALALRGDDRPLK